MKIAIAEYFMFGKEPLDVALDQVHEIGYEHVELLVPQRFADGDGDEQAESLVRLLRSSGLGVSALLSGWPLASPDPEHRAAAVQDFTSTARLAGKLECPYLTSEMSGGNSLQRDESLDAFQESLEAIVPVLEVEGVEVAFEPHPGDVVEQQGLALKILRDLAHPRVGYLYCAPHTFILGENIAAMIREAGDLLKYVHVADSNRPSKIVVGYAPKGYANALEADEYKGVMNAHEHLLPGRGDVDLAAMFDALVDIRYDGYVSLIPFDVDTPHATATVAHRLVTQLIGAG